MEGIDPNLTKQQKKEVFHQQMEMHRRNCLYEKVDMMTMYPSNVEVEIIQVTDGTVIESYEKHVAEKETYTQKKSDNAFKKADYMSKADANLAKIRDDTAKAASSTPVNYSSNSSSNSSWFSSASTEDKYAAKIDRLPTPPPNNDSKYDTSSNSNTSSSYGAPAPAPKAYVPASVPDSDTASRADKFIKLLQLPVPAKKPFRSSSTNADVLSLKSEGDKCVQKGEFVEAIMKYSEILVGFSLPVSQKADNDFLLKVYSNRSLSFMMLKSNDITKLEAHKTKSQALTAALEAALDDCNTVLNFLDSDNIKCLVRGMTVSSAINHKQCSRELAQRLVNMGSSKVGQQNYDAAQAMLKK